ncbi:MAG: hypothetical protein ACRBI6_12295 [Acidimicrobiales bacterium]
MRTAANSYYAWAGTSNTGYNTKRYLDPLDTSGILTHDTVIAVEVVNEPHPRPNIGGAATQQAQNEIALTYSELVDHIQTVQSNQNADTQLVVLGAYHGGTRFGGVITNDTFAHNEIAAISATHDNVIWTAHSYYTGYGDNAQGDDRNDGFQNNGGRGSAVGWAENPSTDAGCYSNPLADSFAIASGWDCDAGFLNRSEAQLGLRQNAFWQQEYAQQAGMPFFLGEWGIPRQRYQNNGYRGIDGAELFYCDAFAAFENPDDNAGTDDPINWAVWSFDARVDGFGLYLSQAQTGLAGREFLNADTWVDAGTFPASQEDWTGADWTYAQAFDLDPSGNGCRQ